MSFRKSFFEVMPAEPTPGPSGEQRVAEYAFKFRSPCEVFNCINVQRCKEEQLACKSFERFVARSNGYNPLPPSEPSREIFDRIYCEDEAEDFGT